MLNKRKQSALSNDNSLKGILQKKEIKSHHHTDPSEEYNIKRETPINGLPLRSIKQSKKVKPQFLLYQRMQEKLQNIQQKIQQLKANMIKRKTDRMKRTEQRNKQVNKQIKKKNSETKTDVKLNYNINQKVKLIQSIEPEKKLNAEKVKEAKNIEVRENSQNKQKENEKQIDINQFVSNQKTSVKQALSINSLVTSMPESKGHAFEMNPYSPRSSVYYVSQAIKGYKDKGSLVYQHLKTSIHLFNYFSQYRMPLNSQVQKRALNLPIKPGYEDKKTILFDLDQTLIHCTQNLHQKHQIELPISFPNGTKIVAGLNIRPGATAILQALYQNFELIIFTASHNCYANVVIDYLDPQKKYIQHRLYREHCHLTANGEYIKDLRIINRQFKNMVLVDNAAYSYAFQPQNGIPIIPYYHGENDYELKMLSVYLQKLLFVADVRLENRKTFKLNRYRDYKHNEVEELVQNLYINKNQQHN